MFSVYRKELKVYFRTLSTYIYLTVLLATIGICAVIWAPMGALQIIPVSLTPFTLIIVPLMQISANRRKKRTHFEEYCFAMGISPVSLTVGRFLASLTVFLIPVLELALLAPLLSMFGSVPYGSVYTAALGYLMLIALLSAMVQTILNGVQSNRLGAVCAFVPSLAFYLFQFLMTILPLGETALSLLTAINPIGLFYAFTYGRFPIADLVSLLAGTALCLCVGIALCHRRRGDWALPTRRRTTLVLTAIALILTLGLSMGTALLPERLLNPTVNNSKTFEIVGQTKDYLKTLKQDVTIYYLVAGGKKSADIDMQYFLQDLAAQSPHLNVKIVDTEKETAFLSRYGASNLTNQSFIIESNNRYFLLDNSDIYHYYNSQLQISLSPAQYTYYISAYTAYLQTQNQSLYDETALAYGQQLYDYAQFTMAYFDGCARLTNAIDYVTSEKVPTVKIFGSKDAMDASLRSYLVGSGYYFEEIASPLDIGNDCELLLLHTPKTDITAAEATALSNYLAGGGKVFLITSHAYSNLPNLYSVTQEFGLDAQDAEKVVCEQDKQYLYSAELPDCFLAHVRECDFTKTFTDSFVLITAHAIEISKNSPEGVTVTPLFYTGKETGTLCAVDANGKLVKEEGENVGTEYVCGVLAQKGEGQLLWLSSPASASSVAYNFSQTDNFTLIRSAMNWMTNNTYKTVSIPSTLMTQNTLAIDTNGVSILTVILALVVPMAFIVPSAVYLYKRKKR